MDNNGYKIINFLFCWKLKMYIYFSKNKCNVWIILRIQTDNA